MTDPQRERDQPLDFAQDKLLRLFADILDYPTAELAGKIEQCQELVAAKASGAVPLLEAFRTFTHETPLDHLEEVYTAFFDLNAACHPYVGYQLFGASHSRSNLLLGLKALYRKEGFQVTEGELPDRLSDVLRFVAHSQDERRKAAILKRELLPAVGRMVQQIETGELAPEKPDTGRSDAEMEGDHGGEVKGGFLLSLTEGVDSASLPISHPYHQALRALLNLLETLCPTHPEESGAGERGGAIKS